uniref:Uncharacterized protein n=1 Tax=Arundo donax TaxID=35708 RepID=A0A0A9C9R0_ARUDO
MMEEAIMAYHASQTSFPMSKQVPFVPRMVASMAYRLIAVSMEKWKLIPNLRKLKLSLMDPAKRRYSRSQMRFYLVLAAIAWKQSSAITTITVSTNLGTFAGSVKGIGLPVEL